MKAKLIVLIRHLKSPLRGVGGLLLFILWRGAVGEAKAQVNLVPNWSFEDTLQCPIHPDGSLLATGFSTICKNWYNPTISSPDYLNGCAPQVIVGNMNVPNNYPSYGWQYARTGVAYSAISTDNGNLEYIQVELDSILISQNKYCVEFYANKLNNVNFACNNLGLYFSDIPLLFSNPNNYIGLIPQINDTNIITDTVNWVKISGEYIASGNEQYITIGRFYPDSSTNFTQTGTTGFGSSHYYIDDVSVIDCTGSGLGIEEKEDENGISIYPNPSEGSFAVKSEKSKLTSVAVYNLLGEKVFYKEYKETSTIILNIDSPPGVYFVELQTQSGVMRKKFVKQ